MYGAKTLLDIHNAVCALTEPSIDVAYLASKVDIADADAFKILSATIVLSAARQSFDETIKQLNAKYKVPK